MVRRHFINLALPIFDFAPPLNAIAIITNLLILAGGYLPPCKMGRRIITMLEHHKFPGWCSNITRFFVSASPAVRSDARAQKISFFTMATMINLAICISPQKQRCQHPLAGDNALTTTAAKGRDDATLMTMAIPASLDEGQDGNQHNNQHFVVGAAKVRPFVAYEEEAACRASKERTRGQCPDNDSPPKDVTAPP